MSLRVNFRLEVMLDFFNIAHLFGACSTKTVKLVLSFLVYRFVELHRLCIDLLEVSRALAFVDERLSRLYLHFIRKVKELLVTGVKTIDAC